MPIEDIDYLKQNSKKQSYQFLINSKDRDKETYVEPSEYVVDFSQPFTNVIGLSILDASIPRTMYNIDKYNNKLYFFIYSSNYDINEISEGIFQEKTIEPGDYTIQTLIDTLNNELVMPLNSNISNSNVGITVSSVTNPPDIQNKIQFYCPYSFMFDMKRSTIAESLGFDTHVQLSENNKSNIDKRYVPFLLDNYIGITDNDVIGVYDMLKSKIDLDKIQESYSIDLINRIQPFSTNKQIYHSVDLPFDEGKGTVYDLFEGPRGVIRQISLSNQNVAQQIICDNDTNLTRVYTAFYSDNISSNVVHFEIQTDNNNEPSGTVVGDDYTIAISYTDGTLSDSEVLSLPLSGGNKYWIVFKTTANVSLYYNDVLNDANTLKYYDSSWISVDDTVNEIYYQASIRVEVTDDYHRIEAPGIFSLIGEPYLVIRCKEIEENSFRSLSYSKYQLGIGKIKLGIVGYSDERFDYSSVPMTEFHPIGKLSRLTLRFETSTGNLYDFKGVNHNILFTVTYYEPEQKELFKRSLINANYDGDFMNYMYRQEEQEEESDDQDVEYNQDDLQRYREAESRNLPWMVAQRDVQRYYDLNINSDEYEEDSD